MLWRVALLWLCRGRGMWLRRAPGSGTWWCLRCVVWCGLAVCCGVSHFVLVLGGLPWFRQLSCCCVARFFLSFFCCVARFVVLRCVVVFGIVFCRVGVRLVLGYALFSCVVPCCVMWCVGVSCGCPLWCAVLWFVASCCTVAHWLILMVFVLRFFLWHFSLSHVVWRRIVLVVCWLCVIVVSCGAVLHGVVLCFAVVLSGSGSFVVAWRYVCLGAVLRRVAFGCMLVRAVGYCGAMLCVVAWRIGCMV